MFSNISDAWSKDPVREITDKLSKGVFRSETEQSNVFNFKSQKKDVNEKKNLTADKEGINLTDDSLSLFSENVISDGIVSDNKPFSRIVSDNQLFSNSYAPNSVHSQSDDYYPVNFDKYPVSKKKYHVPHNPSTSVVTDTESSEPKLFDSVEESRCNYSTRHLKKCDHCYNKLKKMINTKINKKIDEMVLDRKIKQLQNMPTSTQKNTSVLSDSWKETLIIIIGAVIAIFIIFLIVRCFR